MYNKTLRVKTRAVSKVCRSHVFQLVWFAQKILFRKQKSNEREREREMIA